MFAFLIVEYVGLAVYRGIQEVEGLTGNDTDLMTHNNTAKQIIRNLGYLCANLAFIVNINRWLHIINLRVTEEDEETLN